MLGSSAKRSRICKPVVPASPSIKTFAIQALSDQNKLKQQV
jgi:hypothetical protein